MGGGGSSYFPHSAPDLEKLIRDAKKQADRARLDGDVNRLLRDVLASYERDPDEVESYLDEIGEVLKDKADMQQFLFGGSVAKHTYVDGLSDIDALVVLKAGDKSRDPEAVLQQLAKSLRVNLRYDQVHKIEKGTLAVTVTYRNGTQIQLLPAIRTGSKISIPDAKGKCWNETKPMLFQRALTKANNRLDGHLVPTIKLAKSIIAALPPQKGLTGYHVEALALEAFKGYSAGKTVKALLPHFFENAAPRVMEGIRDITGQSRTVDAYLGKPRSTKRRVVRDALARIARRLKTATTVEGWKQIVEE